jgi:hypothetical protein
MVWGVRFHFAEDATVPAVLPELTKHLIGLAVAILAAALGVEMARSRFRREESAGRDGVHRAM